MIICDSCKATGKISEACGETEFKAETVRRDSINSNRLHLCKDCQLKLTSIMWNLEWTIKERGIIHLADGLSEVRTTKKS